jgi:exo-1,4-beta-D-glucosaminidase
MGRYLFVAAVLCGLVTMLHASEPGKKRIAQTSLRLRLHQNWMLQSACKLKAGGQEISSLHFKPSGWHRTTVPSTVLAALVADKTYPDPFFGMNLRQIPGTTYPVATNFAHQPMPEDSPFKCSWWYRTEFLIPPAFRGKNLWLHFQAINYRANVWVNGKQIADSNAMAGAYRAFELDVTDATRGASKAVLAVEVFAPEPHDLAINWVDWNPMPPDKDMGIWKDVDLIASGPVTLRFPFLTSKVDPGLTRASVTISAQLTNVTDQPINGTLVATLGEVRVHQQVELAAKEVKSVSFSPSQYPQLNVSQPRLWWPYQMGTPDLYDLSMQFLVNSRISDSVRTRVGIREITSELDEQRNRIFKINGKKLLIRGGGWAPDMLLRQSKTRLLQEFSYVKQLYLNTIRLEGKIETEEFFDLADQQGILVMAGWCCCDIWEEWDKWQPENHHVAVESLRSQALRLRRHPSVLVWLYGSDNPPPPEVEREYLEVLQQTEWPDPSMSSASQTPTSVTGASGVKMTGPYQYVPPSYWLNPTSNTLKLGGAFGFNTETSPGPAIPPLDSLKKMLPKDHLWPIDDFWNFHAGSQEFKNLDVFNNAMEATYGKPSDLQDYLKKSQAMAYDGERAMFEAYRRNKYVSTGVIQWMLNNAWPSTIWHLYDYYLEPAGGFFGTRKANEPVHIQFSYDDRSVVVVNDLPQPAGFTAIAELYDFDLNKKFAKELPVTAEADSSNKLFTIPEPEPALPISFLRLQLKDDKPRIVSTNFYWLPAKYATFDWAATTFVNTPSPSYEDLTSLNRLPEAKIQMSAAVVNDGANRKVRVKLKNSGTVLAFQMCVRIFDSTTDHDLLPVLWDDNYFELMPGESRTITATYDAKQIQGVRPVVELSGWNVAPRNQRLGSTPRSRRKGEDQKR